VTTDAIIVDGADMADFQYHPHPDSKFATKFEEAFTDLKCTSPRYSN
jgi:hypothetical protein